MRRLFLMLGALCAACGLVWADGATNLPPKAQFHIFLLAGQSNMAGRGTVDEADRQVVPHVLVLAQDGNWKPAVDPLHYDKKGAGVGPGRTFAVALAAAHGQEWIGLVPAACGGSPISTWVPGGFHEQTASHPYDDALARTRRAMQDGVLAGILWHQGESDCTAALSLQYEEKLRQLIARFRHDLEAPAVPFLIGQLGSFDGVPWDAAHRTVDAAQRTVAQAMPSVAFVSAAGLTCKPDKIHFDAPSQREFGRRYAETYLKLHSGAAPADDH